MQPHSVACRTTFALLLAVLGVVGAVSLTGVASGADGQQDTLGAIHNSVLTDANQVVVVNAASVNTSVATVTVYSWNSDHWQIGLGPFSASIGSNGFTSTPHEADNFTPSGEYKITKMFGANADPGSAFPYVQATANDHWVDDPTSPEYNTWQTGDAAGRWGSAETLSEYSYAIAFDFNQNPVVPNGNSAIFLHEGAGATPGCIEVSRDDLLSIMRFLSPEQNPAIVLGVQATPPSHPISPQTTTTPTTTTAPVTTSSPAEGAAATGTAPGPSETTTTVANAADAPSIRHYIRSRSLK